MKSLLLFTAIVTTSFACRATAVAQERKQKESAADLVALEKERAAAEKALNEAEDMLSGDEKSYRLAITEKRLERAKKALEAARKTRQLIVRSP